MKVTEPKTSQEPAQAILKVNPKIYPLETVYSAAYVFLDRAYILLDGDPEKEILVRLKPKRTEDDPQTLADEFLNELLNYADYRARAEQTRAIREIILQRALVVAGLGLMQERQPGPRGQSEDPESYLRDERGVTMDWKETGPPPKEGGKDDSQP